MLVYGGKDLARAYRTVRENTIKIAEEIPESKYDFAPAPDTRTVCQVLTHIALSDSFSAVHKEKRTSFAAQQMIFALKPIAFNVESLNGKKRKPGISRKLLPTRNDQ